MRILVTGAAGQLGSDICRVLDRNSKPEVYAFSKNELDISDPSRIKKVFSEIKPEIVYNCAAFANVDGCESQPELAFTINSEAPGLLAGECRNVGATLVHFSSDYIFNGFKREPYLETDTPDPMSVYGRSKLLGDENIAKSGAEHLIIRTSWLYGLKGKNFVETILRLAEEQPYLSIVNDQTGTPTLTSDLARKTIEVASAGKLGIFNITNSGECTWHEFAVEILRLSGMETKEVRPITTAELNRPAKRPAYSALSSVKLQAAGFEPLRDWCESLKEYLTRRHSSYR